MAKKFPDPKDFRALHRGTFSDRLDDTTATVLRDGFSVYVWLQGIDSLRVDGTELEEGSRGSLCLELSASTAKMLGEVLTAAAGE